MTSFDVVGIGENSVDLVYRLPAAPAPGTKVAASSFRLSCGGQVATTVAACAAWGLRTGYVGAFGNDEHANRVREALAAAHVDTSFSLVCDVPNRHAVILVDASNGDRTVVWHRDPRLALTAEDLPADVLRGARLVHVDDLDEEAAIAAARIAASAGIPVTSDIDRTTERTLELIALSTAPILSAHVPATLTGEDDPERALQKLRTGHAGWLCVTLGSHGAMLLEGAQVHHLPAFAVDAVDTTGAGDVFRAGFIYALLQKQSPAEILRFAAAAAALSCMRDGAIASVPALRDVQRTLRAEP
jgi:sugar/nucleoside kinase (ribokinase family)